MTSRGGVALVTGASAGIGREIVRQLAAGGAQVVATGRDAGRLAAVVAENPIAITPIAADLADAADCARLIASVAARFPGLSLLVNNAGSQTMMDFVGAGPSSAAAAAAEIAVNLTAPIRLIAGLMPLLQRQPAAAIVNVTSGLVLAPKRSAPVYGATKAGLRSFTTALRAQCRAACPQVRVIEAVMPLVATGMTAGRGRGKLDPADAARRLLAGLARKDDEIWIGKTQLLRLVWRLSPALAARLLRDG